MINLAARMMAEKRRKGVSATEHREHQKRDARTPRTAKRCFSGANSMWRACYRYW